MKQCKILVSYDESDLSQTGKVEFDMPNPATFEALAIVRGSLLALTDKLKVKIKQAARNEDY